MKLNPVATDSNPIEKRTTPATGWRRGETWLPILLLFGGVMLLFLPSLQNGFVSFDDPDYVTANPYVRQGLTAQGIQWAWRSTEIGNWHPITRLSHMLDCEFFGLQPSGHHFTSILLHAINTALVFLVFRRLTGWLWPSFFLAAFFGAHPLRVESVTWISERKDVLSTMFGLLTLWCYARYGKEIEPRAAPARRHQILAVVFFACALMSKPMLVTLPCLLWLLDYWPLGRFSKANLRGLLLEKWPFILLAAAACVITVATQQQAGAVDAGFTFRYRIDNAVVAYGRYLGKLFYPRDLAFFYPHPAAWPITTVGGAQMLVLLISAAAIRLRKSQPFLLIGWLWFLGTLVPVIGLIQVGRQSMADRYSYIPSLGVILMMVGSAHWLCQRWPRLRLPMLMLAGLALGWCSVATRHQILHWKDDQALASHALAVTAENYIAHDLLGATLEKRKRYAEALTEHLQAIKIKPDYAEAHSHAGVALAGMGHFGEAIGEHERALRLRPRFPEALYNLAAALENAGRAEEARNRYLAALQIRPTYTDARYNLGLLYARTGRYEAAREQFTATLRLEPASADAENNLALTLEKLGRLDEAISHYHRAIQLKPDYARAHFNLGGALGRKGDLDGAAKYFTEALRINPEYAAARTNLNLLLDMKRTPGGPDK